MEVESGGGRVVVMKVGSVEVKGAGQVEGWAVGTVEDRVVVREEGREVGLAAAEAEG